jgi:hypothetical protein
MFPGFCRANLAGALVLALCCLVPATGRSDAGKAAVLVDGVPIRVAELDAHVAATGLSREDALDDLVNLQLVRAAASKSKLKVPAGRWSAEKRAAIELALAKALGLDLPPTRVYLTVDHAWLKDVEDEAGRIAGREQMEKLRELVEAGAPLPQAYEQLQADGSSWHIGDHEEYADDILPEEARNLAAGTLSPLIPGDGGLHLLMVHQRREEPPSAGEIHDLLMEQLRIDATVDLPDDAEE